MDRIYNQTILDSMKKKNAPPLPPKGPPGRIISHDFPGWGVIIPVSVGVLLFVVVMVVIIFTEVLQ